MVNLMLGVVSIKKEMEKKKKEREDHFSCSVKNG